MIAQAFTHSLVESIRDKPTYSIEEAMKEIEPFCEFDMEKLKQQALRRIVLQCARQITDEDGQRMTYALPNENKLVNLLVCRDKALWAKVDRHLAMKAKSIAISSARINRQRKRIQEGQISMFDETPAQEVGS